MADRVEFSTFETSDGTIGIVRDNAARQSIANIREGKEAVGAVAWENVKGRPTKVSSFENDKKYQTDENVSNTLNSTLYAGSSTHGGPATSADKLTTARTISLTGAASGSGSFDGSANSSINVQSLDATKLTGTVPITNLPPSVIERMSVVKDDTERFALTTDSVQDGDVVKVQSSNLMYYVVDDTKLSTEAGYEVFKAGSAASVPWGGVTDKPSSYPPSSHTHTKSQITDFPSSMPNPNNLTMQIEGNDAAVYNGGTAQAFNVTKSALGLDKVNNTADADKSVKYASSAPWIGVTGKPSTFPPSAHTHDDRYEIAYRSNFVSNDEYIRLGIATMRQQGDYLFIRVYSGSGYNGRITQDRAFDIHLRTSNGSGSLYAGYVEYHLNGSSNNDVYIVPNSSGTMYDIWIGLTSYSGNGFYIVEESNGAGWSNSQTTSNSIPSGAIKLTQKNIAYTSDIPTSLPASDVYSWAKAENKPSYSWNEITGKPSTFTPSSHTHTKDQVGLGNVANLDQSKAIKSITRSGTTFTATALDGTTSTFTQQDINTTYGLASQSSNGLMSAADKKAVDREFFRMLPKGGTVIPNGANLNSTAYLKVGNYYQSPTVNTTNMTNIPIKSAFMMYVLSPLSEAYDNEETSVWVYRLRIFITHEGQIFTQLVYSDTTPGNFHYGPWIKQTNSNDLGAVSNKSAKYTLAASNWSGSSAPYTYDLGPTYGANAIIGFDSATGTQEQLEAASAANIQGSSTTKIYAYGDKPTVDIPIIIQYS